MERKIDLNLFILYKYGIPRGAVKFEENQILSQEKDISTGQWTEWKVIDKEDNELYEFPLSEISSLIVEFEKKDWVSKDQVNFNSEICYKKYMDITGDLDGKEETSSIFVERGAKKPLDIAIYAGKVIAFITMRRDGCLMLVKKGYENLTPLKDYNDKTLSQANHTVKHLGKFNIPMSDGIKLASEIYIPGDLKKGQKVPTILIRTPYGRLAYLESEFRFVLRGYALVAQDCRGRGDSEGIFVPNNNEMDDGDDTLNWIASQEWSNGKVGMIGGSYGGYVQWAAAASGNPHLRALVSLVTSGSAFIDTPRKGGILMSGMLAWCMLVSERVASPESMNRTDWSQVVNYRPIKDIPEKALNKKIPFWDDWISHADCDEFWKKTDWSIYGDRIDVPSLIVSGWYDDDGQGSSQAWDMLKKHGRKDKHMILGPWYHKANTTRDIHNIPFGNNAIRYDMDITYLRWFDRYLKEIDNGIDREDPVEYYMVGSNTWEKNGNWPPKESKLTPMYLHENSNLNFDIPTTMERADKYIFDPQDPAPHLVDLSENELNVPENYSEMEKREDVLIYTTDILEEEIAIAGDIYGTIYASTSGKDTDWVIRVTDVDEEGNSIRVSDGILRARYRNGFEKSELLIPGSIEKYRLRLTRIGYVFKKGHRVRVQVTSGAKNLAFPNCNTGEDPSFAVDFVPVQQTIYHDAEHPSFIEIPLIKKN